MICTGTYVKSGRVCRADAVTAITAMCVHEHLHAGQLCGDCLRLKDAVICAECRRGREPHECWMTVREQREEAR